MDDDRDLALDVSDPNSDLYHNYSLHHLQSHVIYHSPMNPILLPSTNSPFNAPISIYSSASSLQRKAS